MEEVASHNKVDDCWLVIGNDATGEWCEYSVLKSVRTCLLYLCMLLCIRPPFMNYNGMLSLTQNIYCILFYIYISIPIFIYTKYNKVGPRYMM
jgi:hypothetical protein